MPLVEAVVVECHGGARNWLNVRMEPVNLGAVVHYEQRVRDGMHLHPGDSVSGVHAL